MNHITLYSQDRNCFIQELNDVHRNYLNICLQDNPGINVQSGPILKVRDLEPHLHVHYVDKNRDLDAVAPIAPKSAFHQYDRKTLQPLLDALATGDFELAEALTPVNHRLCGYVELQETTRKEEYAIGWAGQFTQIDVPAGVYPIFIEKFAYHERDRHFTNEAAYTGIFEWFEGTLAASSEPYSSVGSPRVIFEHPYSFSLSAEILKGKKDVHLIHPFIAVSSLFQGADGMFFTSHSIVDSSIPYNAKCNPVTLRGRSIPHKTRKKSLSEQLSQAESVRFGSAYVSQGKDIANRQPDAGR